MKASAGLLAYRERGGTLEVLLVHPGGPYWNNKDDGAWSIPKGESQAGEDLLACAKREACEELGTDLIVHGPFLQLVPVKQSQKIVHAWAVKGDFDTATLASNTFTIEYPPHSGNSRTFPEVDQALWFAIAVAREKIVVAQRALLDQLVELLKTSAPA